MLFASAGMARAAQAIHRTLQTCSLQTASKYRQELGAGRCSMICSAVHTTVRRGPETDSNWQSVVDYSLIVLHHVSAFATA
jgi:hypothetical protein